MYRSFVSASQPSITPSISWSSTLLCSGSASSSSSSCAIMPGELERRRLSSSASSSGSSGMAAPMSLGRVVLRRIDIELSRVDERLDERDDFLEVVDDRLVDGRGGQMLSRPAARRMAHVGSDHDDSPVDSE